MKNPIPLLVIIAALLTGSAFAVPAAKITVSEKVFVDGQNVTLGQISKITGADGRIKDRLDGVFISRAPSAGQYVRVSKNMLISRIIRSGFSTETFDLESPPFVSIFSNRSIVPKNDLIKAANDFLSEKNLVTPGMRLYKPSEISPVRVSQGTVSYRCSAADNGEDPGILTVNVEVLVNGKPESSQQVFYKGKPAAAQVEGPAGAPKPVKKTAGGMKVKRGDPLKLLFEKKNMTITVMGAASQSGCTGDRIRVTTRDEGKTFSAVLQDVNCALIEM